jgi:hypothetical protein
MLDLHPGKAEQGRRSAMSSPRAERDAALLRLRSMNTGMVVAGIAAIGVASAGVAAAAPGHKSAPPVSPSVGQSSTTGGSTNTDDGSSDLQQAPQQVNPNSNPPVVTSGGS